MRLSPLKIFFSFFKSLYSSFTGMLLEIGFGIFILLLGLIISVLAFLIITKLI